MSGGNEPEAALHSPREVGYQESLLEEKLFRSNRLLSDQETAVRVTSIRLATNWRYRGITQFRNDFTFRT